MCTVLALYYCMLNIAYMLEDLGDAKLHRVMNTLTRLGALYSMDIYTAHQYMDVRICTANQIDTVQTRAGTMLILPIEAPLKISSNALKLCSSTIQSYVYTKALW